MRDFFWPMRELNAVFLHKYPFLAVYFFLNVCLCPNPNTSSLSTFSPTSVLSFYFSPTFLYSNSKAFACTHPPFLTLINKKLFNISSSCLLAVAVIVPSVDFLSFNLLVFLDSRVLQYFASKSVVFCTQKAEMSGNQSPRIFNSTTHLDIFKKFKRLKPLEPSPGLLGYFFFVLCLFLCLFLLDYSTVLNTGSHFRGPSFFVTWFGLNDYSLVNSTINRNEKVGFLEKGGDGCDIFEGNWVWDENYPLYQSKDCRFLDEGFRCSENGRPDNFYTKWRWQPKDCNLPRLVYLFIFYFLVVSINEILLIVLLCLVYLCSASNIFLGRIFIFLAQLDTLSFITSSVSIYVILLFSLVCPNRMICIHIQKQFNKLMIIP